MCLRCQRAWDKKGQNMTLEPSWSKIISLKRKNSWHLRHIRHQNTKTSPYKLCKNGWVCAFFLFFYSVRDILQFTVFLDHPVTWASTYDQHRQKQTAHQVASFSTIKFMGITIPPFEDCFEFSKWKCMSVLCFPMSGCEKSMKIFQKGILQQYR